MNGRIAYLEPVSVKSNILLLYILVFPGIVFAQVLVESPKKLPDDLPTEIILFLKFDSVQLTSFRPEGMTKEAYAKLAAHNKNVPRYNAQLYAYASQYPFPYKIVSMTDKANYRAKGAKYMFWINSFEELTVNGGVSGKMCVLDHAGADGTYCALRTGLMQGDARKNKPVVSPTKLEDFAREFAAVYTSSN